MSTLAFADPLPDLGGAGDPQLVDRSADEFPLDSARLLLAVGLAVVAVSETSLGAVFQLVLGISAVGLFAAAAGGWTGKDWLAGVGQLTAVAPAGFSAALFAVGGLAYLTDNHPLLGTLVLFAAVAPSLLTLASAVAGLSVLAFGQQATERRWPVLTYENTARLAVLTLAVCTAVVFLAVLAVGF